MCACLPDVGDSLDLIRAPSSDIGLILHRSGQTPACHIHWLSGVPHFSPNSGILCYLAMLAGNLCG